MSPRRKRGQAEGTAEALIASLTRRAQTPGLPAAEVQTIELELALAKLLLKTVKEAKL